MKVEVWSDIMCPFCYIGKKNYEQALKSLAGAEDIELEWKSFQLDPTIPNDGTSQSESEYLVERKGMSMDQVNGMLENVSNAAQAAGVKMNFDQVVVANTLNAHRLLHFAKSKNLGSELKENLFKAHFSEGLNVGDMDVLVQLAVKVGLDEAESRKVVESDDYAYEVNQDFQEAQNIGVRGVPFFVIDRKYAISGAQPAEVFLQTMEKSLSEWKAAQDKPKLDIISGPSCSPEEGCN